MLEHGFYGTQKKERENLIKFFRVGADFEEQSSNSLFLYLPYKPPSKIKYFIIGSQTCSRQFCWFDRSRVAGGSARYCQAIAPPRRLPVVSHEP